MDVRPEQNEQEDIVVIEQKDRKTRLYIIIAAVLGAALGGVIGSAHTADRWQSTYDELEVRYQELVEEKQELAMTVERRVAELDTQLEQQLEANMQVQVADFQTQLEERDGQIASLERDNSELNDQLKQNEKNLANSTQANVELIHKAEKQVIMLERSRELFQREMGIKTELAKLEDQRDDLIPTIEKLKQDCELFLQGTTWDAKSDACSKQDEANNRLSQINQLIQVHRMDLKEIEAIAKEIGVN
ncbi:chromosome partitioning protein ParA [Vibrio sp. WXL210]|uniref:chromosome partitioning protein ParA n=1 Tax=Vibrio sp. WXL210 TaxID=3450709 RepID=UPI003EC82AF0